MNTHIVFGYSAMGNLKVALKEFGNNENEIIALQDDLSVGPISNLNSLDGRKKRTQWWEDIYQDDENITAKERAKIMDDYQKIIEIKKMSPQKIYVWMGPCALDELGCLNLLSNLKNTKHEIVLVHFPEQKIDSGKEEYRAKSLGGIPPAKALSLRKYGKVLTKREMGSLSYRWLRLSGSDSKLRIRKGVYKFSGKNDNFYDNQIHDLCTNKFAKATAVLGKLIEQSINNLNWDYIFWRIRHLIETGMLKYKGNLSALRSFQIKKGHAKN